MVQSSAISGAIPGAISGAIPGAISGAIPGAIPGAISGAISGAIPGAISGAIPGAIPGAISRCVPSTQVCISYLFLEPGFHVGSLVHSGVMVCLAWSPRSGSSATASAPFSFFPLFPPSSNMSQASRKLPCSLKPCYYCVITVVPAVGVSDLSHSGRGMRNVVEPDLSLHLCF